MNNGESVIRDGGIPIYGMARYPTRVEAEAAARKNAAAMNFAFIDGHMRFPDAGKGFGTAF